MQIPGGEGAEVRPVYVQGPAGGQQLCDFLQLPEVQGGDGVLEPGHAALNVGVRGKDRGPAAAELVPELVLEVVVPAEPQLLAEADHGGVGGVKPAAELAEVHVGGGGGVVLEPAENGRLCFRQGEAMGFFKQWEHGRLLPAPGRP